MDYEDVPVLIAGGSLVGLSTALFLGLHDVPSLVVERHRGTAIHPRAALVNQRTIELYRDAGLEDEIVEASGREFVQNGAIVSVESLGGREIDWYFRNINEGVEDLSPSARIFVTQIGLEPILLKRAEALGARLEYGTELVSFESDDEGVTAVVKGRDDGRERTVRARYLVAADGSHSPVRTRLDIPLEGHGSFSNSITIYFRADVRALLGDRNLSVIYVFGPAPPGLLPVLEGRRRRVPRRQHDDRCGRDALDRPVGRHLRGALRRIRPRGARRARARRSRSRTCNGGIRAPSGRRASRTAVSSSPATPLTTCRRRVASAGTPACRTGTIWPGNSHSCSRADAGPDLLETYDAERRPVAELTVEQAYTRYVLRLAPELGKENLQPLVSEATVELGYRYRSSAVLSEADDDDVLVEDPARPSARPGTRAPHLAVIHDGSSISVLDLMGRNFVLIAGSDGAGLVRRSGRSRRSAGHPRRCVPGRRRLRRRSGPLRAALRHGCDRGCAHPAGRVRRVARARGRLADPEAVLTAALLADSRPLGGGRLGSDDRCACRERLELAERDVPRQVLHAAVGGCDQLAGTLVRESPPYPRGDGLG